MHKNAGFLPEKVVGKCKKIRKKRFTSGNDCVIIMYRERRNFEEDPMLCGRC